MKWYLVVERGQHRGQVIPLTQEFLIGRDHCCNLRPSATSVSHRHCSLRTREERLFVADCQARNGTFVNGRRLAQEEALEPGDRLQVGPLEFVVTVDGLPPSPASGKLDEDAIGDMLLDIDLKASPRAGRADSRASHATARQEIPNANRGNRPAPAVSERDAATVAGQILAEMKGRGFTPRVKQRDHDANPPPNDRS